MGCRCIYRGVSYCSIYNCGRQTQNTRWCYSSSLRGATKVLLRPLLAAFHFLSAASHTHTDAASCVHRSTWQSHRSGGRVLFFSTATRTLCFVFLSSAEMWVTLADTRKQWEHVHYKSNRLERFAILRRKDAFIHVSSGGRKAANLHLAFGEFENLA